MNKQDNESINSIRKLYVEWEKQLYKEYTKLFPEVKYTIRDGVIFPEKYAKSRLKVMFLNREGYDVDCEPYPLHETIREQIEKNVWFFEYQRTLRLHLKQYLTVLDSIRQDGFQNLTDDYVRERVKAADYYELVRLMESVAYCNVKKSDGLPHSNRKNLKEYAEKGIDIIKKQIAFFNPSIILAGDVCSEILDEISDFQYGENLYIDSERRVNIYQVKINNQLFPLVDMFHPSRIKGMSEYYLDFLHALQAVEKNNPLFWNKRLNTKCFL